MTDLDKKDKNRKTNKILLPIIGVVFLIVIIAIAAGSGSSKKTDNTQAASSTKPATTTQAPTTSVADLNKQIVPLFTDQTNFEANLMKNLQTASGMADSANSSSTFHQMWDDLEHTTKYDTVHDSKSDIQATYNKASNLYYNAHQKEPDTLSAWNSDIQQVYTDIGTYAHDYQLDANPDKLSSGSISAAHNAVINKDVDAFNTDLAKAQADIKQLN